MKIKINRFLCLAFLWLSIPSWAQNFSSLWQSHYAYNSIVDVVSGNSKIYAAAENAIFEYDFISKTLNTITTVEGLSGQQISTIYYSETYSYLVIGYDNGLIEIYSENDQSVLSIVDILDKQNITPDRKRINHFFENNGFVYISTDFGVSVYDLDRREFGDTYFLGNAGAQITVKQVAILNNDIYAACLNGNGIKKANVDNPNLIDFQQWETILTGDYHTISTINGNVYTVRSNRALYQISNNASSVILTLPELPLDADVVENSLVFSASNRVSIYDNSLALVNSFQPNENFDTSFTSATIQNGNVYIGSTDFGVLQTQNSENELYLSIKPNGPLGNDIFRLNASNETVWASYGDFSESLNPYPLSERGLSYLNDGVWKTIPSDNLFGARELNTITPNIFNPNQVFISSFFNGILEFNNFEPTVLFNQNNSGLESLTLPNDPNYIDIRVSGTVFDNDGLLWSLNSRVDKALKSYNPLTGNWQGYSFSSLIDDPLSDETGFFEMAIDNNDTKWIGSYSNGLIGFNEKGATNRIKNINSTDQGAPLNSRFASLALDNRNQLWVGTTNGLRVLFNTNGFFEDPNPILRQIIILENGIAKELLEGQSITDIKVDGSNNKWVGTADSGVFYFSPDGQGTIYHFTKDNSPLPSNTINDIDIDNNSGTVYIATNRGLLSFLSGGSKPNETLEDAFVYPNPVRPEYDILGDNNLNDINRGIKVSGLTDRVNIKITDIVGNLVAEAQSNINLRSAGGNYNFAIDGGTAIWNGKNLTGTVVRTGVYLIMISDLISFETKVLKVLIVR